MHASARVRSQMYGALAHAFQKPELASGDEGKNSLMQVLERAACRFDAQALGPIVGRLVGALDVAPGQTRQALIRLEVEYNRLFVGPGRPHASPYESSYRDPWGLVMGPSARQVEQCYAEAGLGLDRDYRDLPDHVATELAFMAYLAMQEAESGDGERETWLKKEHLFLRDHLSVWLPLLCQRVQEASQHPFYTALAELTEEFVRLEMARFETC